MCNDRKGVAIKYKNETVTYERLFRMVASVSGFIYEANNVKQGCRVLIIVDNSIPSIVTMLALSALGCHVDVIGSKKDYEQFKRTVSVAKYDFIFAATEESLEYFDDASIFFITKIWQKAVDHTEYKPFVRVATTISIFTSGSTNISKNARRSNTLLQYLAAIADLVKTLGLNTYKSVILPVPIYHSYGLSVLFLSLMLNKTLVLTNKFDAGEVAAQIVSNNIQVAVVIPQMLHRLLGYDLDCVRCIITCADFLPVSVFLAARQKFGDVIFNLYGTTEAGLATVATPGMLAMKPDTIGRPIRGSNLTLRNENGNSILYVSSRFATKREMLSTGDIATMDENGWYFLRGRVDDLCVINGVNVYPAELLQMAYKNDLIQHVVVKTVKDDNDFNKIKLILKCREGVTMTEREFKEWWVSEYGTRIFPSIIEFTEADTYIKLM